MTMRKLTLFEGGKEYCFATYLNTSDADRWISKERGVFAGDGRCIDGVLHRARRVYGARFWWQKPQVHWELVSQ